MYNAFWWHAFFVRGQSFSVKTFDRLRNGCQVIGEGAGNDFRGPSVQALPLPSRVSFSRARFFSCALYFQAPATQARKWLEAIGWNSGYYDLIMSNNIETERKIWTKDNIETVYTKISEQKIHPYNNNNKSQDQGCDINTFIVRPFFKNNRII